MKNFIKKIIDKLHAMQKPDHPKYLLYVSFNLSLFIIGIFFLHISIKSPISVSTELINFRQNMAIFFIVLWIAFLPIDKIKKEDFLLNIGHSLISLMLYCLVMLYFYNKRLQWPPFDIVASIILVFSVSIFMHSLIKMALPIYEFIRRLIEKKFISESTNKIIKNLESSASILIALSSLYAAVIVCYKIIKSISEHLTLF